jgi:tetratricopeptide (TPR) repeat protein
MSEPSVAPRNTLPADLADLALRCGMLPLPRLVEALREDQARRWRAGERPFAEAYLAAFPALAGSAEDALVLVWGEALLRLERGEAPGLAEYQARFPGHADALAVQFELQRHLAGPARSTDPSGGGSPGEGRPAWPEVPGYEVLGELGRGGMGVVYRARQVGLNRLVALKMVRAGEHAGPEDLARFRAEAEAVAALQHPHVVQIFEVGRHAGLPFFALEYLEGGSLQDRLRGAPLPPREAARLVQTLAGAVQAAHERGLIHRDLKPANVLLAADGTPKVTDFGLAKRVEGGAGLTQSGAVVGTPSYMAPEQAAGKGKAVGPAADVYALGAVLYECLTGRPPFKAATPMETVLQVLGEEPVPPRRLQPQVPPDLETVCLTCLGKEPARRYAGARALADDLRRFLNGEPIQARPVGAWERGVKWARRRPAVTALLAALVVVLAGGFLGLTALWLRADEQRVAAERAREEEAAQRAVAERARGEEAKQRAVAQAVNAFLRQDLLGQADTGKQPFLAGQAERNPQITVRALLDRAAAGVGGQFAGQPEVEAAIRQTIGDAYRALGEYDRAQRHLDRAVAWRREHLGADHPDTLLSLNSLAALYKDRGRYDEAERLLQEALAGLRKKLGADHPDTLTSLNNLAVLYQDRGRYAEAETLYQEALAGLRKKLGADHPDTLTSLNNLAVLYRSRGRYAEAEPLLEEALAGYRRTRGPDHPHTLISLNNLAELYQSRGRHAEAEPLYQEALAGCRRALGADHPATLAILNNLAALYHARGRHAEAEPLDQEALAVRRRTLGADHPDTLRSLNNLAELYRSRGRHAEAEPLLREALAGKRRTLGAAHPDTLSSLNNLALLYQDRGRYPEAEPLLREALAGRRRALGADHPDTLSSLNNLAALYHARGRYAEAEPLYQEALAGCRRTLGADHPATLRGLNNLAALYHARGRHAEAEPLLQEALAVRRRALGADHPDTLRSLNNLAELYRSRGRHAEAEPLLREALAGRRKKLGADHPDTLQSLNNLALLHHARGRSAEAESLLREALAGRRKKLGADHPDTLQSLNNLARLYQARGRHAEAEPLFLEAVAGARRTLGPAHPATQNYLRNLAALYEQAGQPERAEPLWRELVQATRQQPGPQSLPYAGALAALGANLLHRRKPADAGPLLRTCLAIRQGKEPDAWSTSYARSLLGAALAGQQKYAEAEPLLRAGYEGLQAREEAVPPQSQHFLTEALERLVQLYDAWGKPEQAREWRHKLEQAKAPAKGPDP